MDTALLNDITAFLKPYMQDARARRAAIELALLNCPALNGLRWDDPTAWKESSPKGDRFVAYSGSLRG